MAVTNTLTKQNKERPKFSVAIQSDAYKKLVNQTLGDPHRAQRFIASISSAVAINPKLQECDAGSILAAALLGEALSLSPSPQLGQYYLVPYKNKKTGITVAQFQLGYKGYIQMAIRSGYYRKINVLAIKKGELIRWDPLTEEFEAKLIDDEDAREAAETIGYYASFEYLNGFRKVLYWSKEKMECHADTYSEAFSLEAYRKLQNGEIPEADLWKYSSFWYKNFDEMALKTMLRQLISKWGIMSTEMQQAYERDMAAIHEDGSYEYVDTDSGYEPEPENTPEPPKNEPEQKTEQEKEPEKKAQPKKEPEATPEAQTEPEEYDELSFFGKQ